MHGCPGSGVMERKERRRAQTEVLRDVQCRIRWARWMMRGIFRQCQCQARLSVVGRTIIRRTVVAAAMIIPALISRGSRSSFALFHLPIFLIDATATAIPRAVNLDGQNGDHMHPLLHARKRGSTRRSSWRLQSGGLDADSAVQYEVGLVNRLLQVLASRRSLDLK